MRDVIGQDDLEGAEPSPNAARRTRGWAVVAALLAAALVVLATGGVSADHEPASDPRAAGGVGVDRGADTRGGPGNGSRTGGAAGRTGVGGRSLPLPADPALRASLAARPLGGRTVTAGLGARGDVHLEIRNGGAPLRLWALTAEVPGVRFAQVGGPHGLHLGQDERVELVLAFRIDDCGQLRRTGRLVLHVERAGVEQEVGLTVTHDREAGTVRQVALDRVLGACPV